MRRVILGFAAVAPLIAIALFVEHRWLAGIAVVVLSHALILYPTLAPKAQWLGPVVTRFESERNEVWLTIDDGPAEDTRELLDMLDRRGVKATFFVVGRPDLAEIVGRGHAVGNHSASHPSATFWCLGPRRIAEEIDGGIQSSWFRAPVGMKNPFVHPALATRGMQLMGWSVRGFDSVDGDVERVVRRIVGRVRPGSIIVMHQGRAISVRCIERVIDELQARGYAFGRLKTNK